MPHVHFLYTMCTDPGLVRRGNEDCCAASQTDAVLVVCDGMGGAAAGEIASRLAAEVFLQAIASPAPPPQHPIPEAPEAPRSPEDRLRVAIRSANLAVFQKSSQNPELQGMGTTLVAAFLEPEPNPTDQPLPKGTPQSVEKFWIAHVGDSRAYLLRAGELHLLTLDHSVVEEQVQAGFITEEQAESSPMRHVITRSIGSHIRVEPEIRSINAKPGDLLLLASDGLNRELSSADIREILSRFPPEPTQENLSTICKALVEAVNANGGRDNVTVLLTYIP